MSTKRIGRPRRYSAPTARFSIVLPKHDLDYITRHAPETQWGKRVIHSRATGVHNVIAKARQLDALLERLGVESIEDVPAIAGSQ